MWGHVVSRQRKRVRVTKQTNVVNGTDGVLYWSLSTDDGSRMVEAGIVLDELLFTFVKLLLDHK